MIKKTVLILFSALMFILVGCTKTTNSLVGDMINKKYLFDISKDVKWNNKKYGYNIYETLICYFNNHNTLAYVIKKDGNENLQLVDTHFDEDGYEVAFKFKSLSDKYYSLQITLDNDNHLKYKWTRPSGKSSLKKVTDFLDEEECKEKIMKNINTYELNKILATTFQEEYNLDLEIMKIAKNVSSLNYTKSGVVYSREEIQNIFEEESKANGWDEVSVLEGSTEYYNDELCYMLCYSYTKENGLPYANQVFVGNKTLEIYDIFDVYE